MFRRADRRCEQDLGVPVTQLGVLLFVQQHPECLQKEVAEALGLKLPAVTGLVGRMEASGLLRKQPCPQDGRASRLQLTPRGRALLGKAGPLITELNGRLTAGFSEAEIKVVLRFLNGILEHF